MKKVADELNKLLELKEKGALSQQEFDHQKAKLLDLNNTPENRAKSKLSVAKIKSRIETYLRNRPSLYRYIYGQIPTYKSSEIPTHIHDNLAAYEKRVDSSCPECGYIGKMGYQVKIIPWFVRFVPCFLYVVVLMALTPVIFMSIESHPNTPSSSTDLFLPLLLFYALPIFIVYLIYDFFRKELVKCPNCQKTHKLHRAFFK